MRLGANELGGVRKEEFESLDGDILTLNEHKGRLFFLY
jgi:hypothetical protein